jgi:hypothetical protein
MEFQSSNFRELCKELSSIDHFGRDRSAFRPLGSRSEILKAFETGVAYLPIAYRNSYVQFVREVIPSLLIRRKEIDRSQRYHYLERLLAPVYAHAPPYVSHDIRPQLRRLLAVVSNLYRSFNDPKKRESLKIPVVDTLPPLAFFQVLSNQGPYTITTERMTRETGSAVGVVSLPASYRNHPILWSILAHEVCGHDVVHTDPTLIPELVKEVRKLFVGRNFSPSEKPDINNLNALLWSYWIDEAVSDVYAIMNMGPTYALILVALISSMVMRDQIKSGGSRKGLGKLPNKSEPLDKNRGNMRMDGHPTDILRPYVALGAIEGLIGLSPDVRKVYSKAVEEAVDLTSGGQNTISFEGLVEVTHTNWVLINEKVPLRSMQLAAKKVGKFIATHRLSAYSGSSVQDIETWDDADERIAIRIARYMLSGKSVIAQGDDAQLLAGANLAALSDPKRYRKCSKLLELALDDSFNRDPIWAGPRLDLVFSGAFCRERPIV